jgi:hypothetical protein
MVLSSMNATRGRKIRIELDEPGVRALHAALTAALARGLVDDAQAAAARDVLEQLDRRVPGWLASGAAEDPYLGAADAVLDALAAVEAEGRPARLDDGAFEALAGDLRARGLLEPAADGDPAGLALTDAGAALARERWAANASTPHWRIPPPPLPYRELPVRVEPRDRRCPSAGCDGRATWLKPGGRSAAWRALQRDGSVEWTCPACSRTWLVYLQAHKDDGAPAYRDPVEGDHNRPRWRSGR